MRFHGYFDDNGSVNVFDIFTDNSFKLCDEESLKLFLDYINGLDDDWRVLNSLKNELRTDIDTLGRIHESFMEDEDTGITCFGMIRSTLINLYEKMYRERYG